MQKAFDVVYSYDDLLHIGKKRRSGRYPWGSGKRPFQGTEKGKRLSAKKALREEKRRLKKRQNALSRAREAAAEKREYERKKQEALKKGNATEVLKYKDSLTVKELQDAATRIQWERQLENFSKQDQSRATKQIDKAMNNVKMVNNWAKTALGVYTTINAVNKIIENEKAKQKKKS